MPNPVREFYHQVIEGRATFYCTPALLLLLLLKCQFYTALYEFA